MVCSKFPQQRKMTPHSAVTGKLIWFAGGSFVSNLVDGRFANIKKWAYLKYLNE